jgi:hypothetical protein
MDKGGCMSVVMGDIVVPGIVPPLNVSYLTVHAADIWITTHCLNADSWNSATDAQKQIALNQASDHIDALPLKGLRYFPMANQTREFPRFDPGLYQANTDALYLSAYNPSVVPQEVKDACVLEALAILDRLGDADLPLRDKLQDTGVASVGFGGRSESYVPGAKDLYHGLLSKRAYNLLKYWIAISMESV